MFNFSLRQTMAALVQSVTAGVERPTNTTESTAQFVEVAAVLRRHGVLPLTKDSRLITQNAAEIACDIANDLRTTRNGAAISAIAVVARAFAQGTSTGTGPFANLAGSLDARSRIAGQLGHLFTLVMEDTTLAPLRRNFEIRRGTLGLALSYASAVPFLDQLLGVLPSNLPVPKFPWMKLRTAEGRALNTDYELHFPAIRGLSVQAIAALDESRDFAKDCGLSNESFSVLPDPASLEEPETNFRFGLSSYSDIAENLGTTEFFSRLAEYRPHVVEDIMNDGRRRLEGKDRLLAHKVEQSPICDINPIVTGRWLTDFSGQDLVRTRWWIQQRLLEEVSNGDCAFSTVEEEEFDKLLARISDPSSYEMRLVRSECESKFDERLQSEIAQEEYLKREMEKARMKIEAWENHCADLEERFLKAIPMSIRGGSAHFVFVDGNWNDDWVVKDWQLVRDLTLKHPECGITVHQWEQDTLFVGIEFLQRRIRELCDSLPSGATPRLGISLGDADTVFEFAKRGWNLWPELRDIEDRADFQIDTEHRLHDATLFATVAPELAELHLGPYPFSFAVSDHFLAWLTGDVTGPGGDRIPNGIGWVPPSRRYSAEVLEAIVESCNESNSSGNAEAQGE